MEHHLQQQIAQFVAQPAKVVPRDGIGDFVGLLDGVGRDGGETLGAIPFASRIWIAQPGHDGQQSVERGNGRVGGFFGHGSMHRRLPLTWPRVSGAKRLWGQASLVARCLGGETKFGLATPPGRDRFKSDNIYYVQLIRNGVSKRACNTAQARKNNALNRLGASAVCLRTASQQVARAGPSCKSGQCHLQRRAPAHARNSIPSKPTSTCDGTSRAKAA